MAKPGRVALWALVVVVLGCSAPSTTISWRDTSHNEHGFKIYRVTDHTVKAIADVAPDVTFFTDRTAPPGACYRVTAYHAGGESLATPMVCARW